MNDPIRLRDAPGDSRGADLAAVSAAKYSYDVEKGAALLSASIAKVTLPATGGGLLKPGLLKPGLLKMVLSVFVLGALGGTAYLHFSHRAALRPSAPTTVATAVPSSIAPTLVPPVVASAKDDTVTSTVKPAATLRVAAPRASVASSGSLAEETQSLARIRSTAASDPAGSLAMIDDANARFSPGIFREEREAIAVGALAKLGRTSDAHARGTRFLSAFPKSAFAPQVRQNAGL